MKNSIDTFMRARQVATGSKLTVAVPNVPRLCETDSDLKQLVNEYHIFFHEGIGEEVSFLTGRDRSHNLEKYRLLIYNLRTTFFHRGNPKVERFTADWRQNFNSPQEEADNLFTEFSNAMAQLAQLSTKVSRDPAKSAQWREIVLLDLGMIFQSVENDLGLNFTENNRNRMVNLIRTRLKAKPITGDRTQGITDYCAQQILSERNNLPVSYAEVLDKLGLLGNYHSKSALDLAYTIARVHPMLKGEDFLNRVEDAWLNVQLSP